MEILRTGKHNIYTTEAESENAAPISCCADNLCIPTKVCY